MLKLKANTINRNESSISKLILSEIFDRMSLAYSSINSSSTEINDEVKGSAIDKFYFMLLNAERRQVLSQNINNEFPNIDTNAFQAGSYLLSVYNQSQSI